MERRLGGRRRTRSPPPSRFSEQRGHGAGGRRPRRSTSQISQNMKELRPATSTGPLRLDPRRTATCCSAGTSAAPGTAGTTTTSRSPTSSTTTIWPRSATRHSKGTNDQAVRTAPRHRQKRPDPRRPRRRLPPGDGRRARASQRSAAPRLTQSDIAEVLETSQANVSRDRAAAGSLPVDAVTLLARARRHPEGVGRLDDEEVEIGVEPRGPPPDPRDRGGARAVPRRAEGAHAPWCS